ncbi:MAG: hypothetical protein V1686_01445 [Patescibacteria group bacterium]
MSKENPKNNIGKPKGGNGEVPKITPETLGQLLNGGQGWKNVFPAEEAPREPITESSVDVSKEEGVRMVPEEKVKEKGGEKAKRASRPGSEEILPRKLKKPKKSKESIRTAEINEPMAVPDIAEETAEKLEEKQPEAVQEVVAEKSEESNFEKLKKLNFRDLKAKINIYVAGLLLKINGPEGLKDDQIKEELVKMSEMEEVADDFLRSKDSFKTRLSDEEKNKFCNELESARDGLVNLRNKISKEDEKEKTAEERSAPEVKRSVIDLAELDPKIIWSRIDTLNLIDFAVAINDYILKIELKLKDLSPLQTDEEKHRMAGIGRMAMDKLDHAEESIGKNELKTAEENLKTLYDKINPGRKEESASKIATDVPQNETEKPKNEEVWDNLNRLDATELTKEIKKIIGQLKDKMGKLNSEQTEEELRKMTDIGRIAEDMLGDADEKAKRNKLTNKGKEVCNELDREVNNLKELYDTLKRSTEKMTDEASDARQEKPETKSFRKRRFYTEEKRHDDNLSAYATWQLKEERENVNSKINNLIDILKIAIDEKDKNEVSQEIESLGERLKIINNILSSRKSEPEPKIEDKKEENLSQKIERKKQEIEKAEESASIYRPAGGLFRRKPVVRDLGYYGAMYGASGLETLKKELKELQAEEKHETKQGERFEKELGKAQKIIFKDVAREITKEDKIKQALADGQEMLGIKDEDKKKKKIGFFERMLSRIFPERELTEKQILRAVNKKPIKRDWDKERNPMKDK